jgi:hypothetical protein
LIYPPRPSPLARLRAVIVWARMSQAPLVTATGRSILDLPVDVQFTILSALVTEISGLAKTLGVNSLRTRILTNALGARLLFGVGGQVPELTVERHPFDLRGTGGALADAARHYDDDDLVLVLEAAQILEEPLSAVAHDLARANGEVNLFAHADHSPSSVMLVRCGCLRALPRLGVIDMNTHGLEQIARSHRVMVLDRPRAAGCMIESPALYIAALQRHHRRRLPEAVAAASASAPWQPVFSLVEHGGTVAAGAHLHDAVVLKGGRVEAGATVVRSIVGPGGVVRQRQTCIDAIVAPPPPNGSR